MRRFFFKIQFLVWILLLVLVGCTRHSHQNSEHVFRSFAKDDVKSWDPASAYDVVSLGILPNLYETLYQYQYLSEHYLLEPLLATSMPQYSRDKLTVTLSIRHGVLFQDDPCFKATGGKGRELKAQDFIYAWKRLAVPALQSQGWWIFDNKVVGINAFREKLVKAPKEKRAEIFEEPIEGLKALDDYTLQIQLTRPYPDLLYVLGMTFSSPVAREVVEAYGDEHGNIQDHPVGTGPYRLLSWKHNHEILLEKNGNYRMDPYPQQASPLFKEQGYLADAGKPMPFYQRINIQILKESQPRWLNFLSGRMDVVQVPKDSFGQVLLDQNTLLPDLQKKGIQLKIERGTVIHYITFNVKDAVVGPDRMLRQALSSAVDREKWISIFTNGTAKKMVNAIPEGVADRPATRKVKYDFDLKKAKALLAKAGYPDGKGLPLLKFDLRGASTTERQIGDFFAEQFAQIGVHIDVILNTFPAFLEKMKQGDLQISFGAWAMDYPDAENIYELLYGPNQSPGPNDANFNDPEYNRLYQKMEVMEVGPKRAEILQKMDDLMQEECPWILGYYEVEYHLAQPWVRNYRPSEMILNKFKYIRSEKH